MRPGHKRPRRQALQDPWGPPAWLHQLQPQSQLCHLLLLLTKTVTLQDTVQVLTGDVDEREVGSRGADRQKCRKMKMDVIPGNIGGDRGVEIGERRRQ